MFFKKSNEPIVFETDIEVNAPASAVYDVLNLRNANNRYAQRGMTVTQDDENPSRFYMVNPEIPEMTFIFTELSAEPVSLYAMGTAFPNGQPIGVLTGEESRYRIEALGPDRCRVINNGTLFTLPISKKQREKETAMILVSINDDMTRLKALVEEGPDAANKAGALDELFDAIDAAIEEAGKEN